MTTASPFHAGERAIQSRLGVRDRMEQFGSKVIRDHLPEQHRTFFAQLPFVFVGHADARGQPWASVLFNPPGFVASPDARQLIVDATPLPHDPLAASLTPGTRLGLLGIELPTRRRNRVSATLTHVDAAGLHLDVDQSFGNCPQYIQARTHVPRAAPAVPPVTELGGLNDAARAIIEAADTFFVATSLPGASSQTGADVSHRGGQPGFVRIDDDQTLTIPDYLGNFHFNTLGNIHSNPRAGLLFVDFQTGDVLTMTGSADILWDEDLAGFDGAERAWRFRLTEGRLIESAAPLAWSLDEWSPTTLLTGNWARAAENRAAQAARAEFREYRVGALRAESRSVRSVSLEPVDGAPAPFHAGQYLTVRLPCGEETIRTYTVSSAPSDAGYRISVKRDHAADGPPGRASSWIHDTLTPGVIVHARAPQGAFFMDTADRRPALLLAGGIGVTPMIAMARQALLDGIRTRRPRKVTVVQSDRSATDRAFFDDFRQLAAASDGAIRHYSTLGETAGLTAGADYDFAGRIDRAMLQSVLPLASYEVFLCGPPTFMQAMYRLMRDLGVADDAIRAEAFGPAGLTRDGASAAPEADGAVVEFRDSGIEQTWRPADGTLLELAEAHGLTPAHGCRTGACGTCATRLRDGAVTWRTEPRADVADGEILICCAVPAATDDGAALVLDL